MSGEDIRALYGVYNPDDQATFQSVIKNIDGKPHYARMKRSYESSQLSSFFFARRISKNLRF